MATTTKDRILDTSAELFRRQGYMGTGLKQLVAEAGAPFGSIYHFFPGGKEELGAETIRRSGALYLQLFVAIAAEAPDAPSAASAVVLEALATYTPAPAHAVVAPVRGPIGASRRGGGCDCGGHRHLDPAQVHNARLALRQVHRRAVGELEAVGGLGDVVDRD